MKRLTLLPRIIIAIAAGIGAGFVFPEWLSRCFATFNSLFSAFLGFIIPLLIVGFVAPAITELGRRAGRMLVVTAAIAYAMTFAVGMLAYFTSSAFFPLLVQPGSFAGVDTAAGGYVPAPFFTVNIEPLMGVMSALVLALLLGLGCSALSSRALSGAVADFRDVIRLTITGVIIPCLPLYIFGIFLSMTTAGIVGHVLGTFFSIIVVIFILHVAVLVAQYLLASLFTGYNPFRSLWTMMPAYFTALGTAGDARGGNDGDAEHGDETGEHGQVIVHAVSNHQGHGAADNLERGA